MGSIVAEIDAWIIAISSNPSIVANGQLPVKLKGPTDSTNSGVTNGFVYEFPDTTIGLNADGPTYPTLLIEGVQTSLRVSVGDGYNNNSSLNEGFGSIYAGSADGQGHASSESWAGDANYDREAIIVYDDTDGEEFFAVGMKMGASGSDSGGFIVFKDSDNHWCFAIEDGGFAYDNVLGYWTGQSGAHDTDPIGTPNGGIQTAITLYASQPGGAANKSGYDNAIQYWWYAASSCIYDGRGTGARYGNYSYLPGGTEIIIELGYDSPAVKVPFSGGGS